MPIVVVDNGIEDARRADLGGFLVSLDAFSISEATGVEVRSDRDKLVGPELYRGSILSIEAINRDSVRLTCAIPRDRPLTGQWNVTEIGIWNKNGRLFAHGVFAPFPKSAEYGLKFYVYVTLGRLGDVINITNTDNYSLPSAARVASLQPPETVSQNTVVVMDSNSHQAEVDSGLPDDSSSPDLAVKFGGDGDNWGFTGHTRIYTGTVTKVNSLRMFTLDPGSFGFWLADNEIVIVSVVDGAGKGQSRKMKYNAAGKTFTSIDDAFKNFDVNSRIMLWRSHEAALPRRHPGIPDYFVLGHGRNTYGNTTVSIPATRLDPYLHVFTGTGTDGYTIPDNQLPLSRVQDKSFLIVQPENGPILRPDQYVLIGNQLRIVGNLENGRRCCVWAFAKSDSTGGLTRNQDVVRDSTGEAEYTLPTMPKDSNAVFIQDSTGKIYSKSDFAVIGAKVVFASNSVPPVGRTITIVIAAVATSYSQRGALTRSTSVAASATREVTAPRLISDKANAILIVNGSIVGHDRFSVAGDKITTIDTIPAGASVDVIVFWYDDTTSVTARSGYDTGPQWIDPAGEQGVPNRLIPGRVSYIAGVTIQSPSFPVDTVPDAEHLIVFVGQSYLPPTEYTYDGQNIWPKEIVQTGTRVEVFCFRSVDHAGTEAAPKLTNIRTTTSKTVQIHAGANTQSLIVTLGRVYIHSSQYTYNAATGALTFGNEVTVTPDVTVMAWSYADQNVTGKQVRMYHTLQAFVTGVNRYPLQGTLGAVQDVLPFMEGELLGYTSWTLTAQGGIYYQNFTYTQPGWANQQMQSIEFSSRIPQRRLVLRNELDGFLQADKNLSDVADKAQARANLGITDNPGGPSLGDALLKVNNLADVLDKAAARNNLGITDLLSSMMQSVLLKNNNLADVPNKVQARANLGIVGDGSSGLVTTSFPQIANIGVSYYGAVDFGGAGGFKIRFGHYWNPSEPNYEGLSPVIQFRNGEKNLSPFSSMCFGVLSIDLNPANNIWIRRDTVTQLAEFNKNSFRFFLNQPGDATGYWRGCFWVAFGV